MADEAGEKRMERAAPPTPTASSAGPTLAVQGNCGSIDWAGMNAKKASISGTSAGPPRPAVSTSTVAISHRLLCRPWDCGDLLRRLATFRLSCWNHKPQAIGPAACARKGWVNADIDIISCEGCDKHLRFEAEAGVESFRELLDTGHQGTCPWKGNACSESLAQVPSSLMALIGGYNDRCDALLQLHSLPLVSALALDQMKLSRGPQIDRLLSQAPVIPGMEFQSSLGAETFCKVQRIISFCGWEPRLLPHAADFEDHSAQSTRNACVMKKRGKRNAMPRPEKERERSSRATYVPACTLLECVYCGANVNILRFLTLTRPPLVGGGGRVAHGGVAAGEEVFPQVSEVKNRVLVRGVSAASSIDMGTRKRQAVEWGATSERKQPNSVVRGASTSAGVSRQQQQQQQQGEGSEMGDCCAVSYESRREEQQAQGGDNTSLLYVASVRAESTNGAFDEEEGKSCAVGGESSRRKRGAECLAADQHSFGGDNGASEAEADAEIGNNEHKNKRKCVVEPSRNTTNNTNNTNNNNNNKSSRVKVTLKRKLTGEFPCSSSVNATDTCFQNKTENSMESVEFLPEQEEDAQQHTAASGYTENEWLFDEPNTNSTVQEVAAPVETTKSNTNAAVMSSGTGTGGGGSVGMMVIGGGAEVGEGGGVEGGGDQQTESVAGVIDAVVENDTSREAVVKDVEDESGDSLRRPPRCSEEDRTIDTTVALIFTAKEVTDGSVDATVAAAGAAAGAEDERAVANSAPTTAKDGGEFDPIGSHRSFCPWVNGPVLAAANGTFGDAAVCGWQLTVDALDAFLLQENLAAGVTESESTASMCKDDDSKRIASSSQLCCNEA